MTRVDTSTVGRTRRDFARRALAGVAVLASWSIGAAAAKVIEVPAPQPGGPSAFELIQTGLSQARAARQAAPLEPLVLRLASGIYRIDKPIIIEPRDAGPVNEPFVIEGAADGSTRIYGSVERQSRPATAADLAGTVSPPVPVRVMDLSTDAGEQPLSLVTRGAYNGTPTSRFEIFQGDVRFQPSSWPRSGYMSDIATSPDTASGGVRVKPPSDIFAQFQGQKDLRLGGYWIADWAYETLPVLNSAIATGEFVTGRSAAPLPVQPKVRIRILNAMSALDTPGRYVLDATSKRAFIVPLPGDNPRFEVAVARELMVFASVQNVALRNIGFERTLGTPVRVENSSNLVIENCLVRNSGNRGITVTGGRDVTIKRCVVTDMAETGVLLSGGTRRSLTPARHAVVDSIFTRFAQDSPTYRPGVEIQGVGNSVIGSYFSEAPHSAILVSGNDHRLALNEISDVVRETNDAGAIYMGRDFTARGNVFTDNYLHDIGDPEGKRRALIGIYLDDQFSGATVARNVFRRVTVPVQIGGGRDNLVESNAFLESQRSAVLFDNRGEHKHKAMVETGELNTKLNAMPFRQPPWSTRYPTLATLPEDRIGVPLGNVVRNNLLLGRTMIEYEYPDSRPYLSDEGTVSAIMPLGVGPQTSTIALLAMLSATNLAANPLRVAVADRYTALRGLTFAAAAFPGAR